MFSYKIVKFRAKSQTNDENPIRWDQVCMFWYLPKDDNDRVLSNILRQPLCSLVYIITVLILSISGIKNQNALKSDQSTSSVVLFPKRWVYFIWWVFLLKTHFWYKWLFFFFQIVFVCFSSKLMVLSLAMAAATGPRRWQPYNINSVL